MGITYIRSIRDAPLGVECYFCKVTIDSEDAAVQAGWIPSFIMVPPAFEGKVGIHEILQAVCPDCIEAKLSFNQKDQEYYHFQEPK